MSTKTILILLTCVLPCSIQTIAQKNDAPNLIIVTIDGLRWQEVFNGIDTSIANYKKYNEGDSLYIVNRFGDKPIMPFVTNTIGTQGQLWGNRNFNSNGSVANRYWFSYPGYSELFCGYADTLINSNNYKLNPNTTLLDFLQKQKSYKNKIAAFAAWDAFDRILNEPRAGFQVCKSYDVYVNSKSKQTALLNKLNQEAYKPWDNDECLDVFTHNFAMDYLATQKPKVLYVAYGETDEWAHAGKYKSYLNAAAQVDKWIAELWDFVQNNKKYKDNTILLVTVDHGRGLGKEWTSHNKKTAHSNETWFGILGKGVAATGMQKNNSYAQEQLAQTIAQLLGLDFKCEHPVANAVPQQ